MWGTGTRRIVICLAAIGATALGAGYAFGASETITTSPTCCTYSQPTFTIDAGQVAEFQNQTSGVDHTMTASTKGPDHKALFNSGTTASGQEAAAQGTQYLAPGTYHFFCLVHGPSMSADLVVSGNGAPVARPDVKVKVMSSKLDTVASSGKLKLRVRAVTESDNVTLLARKGAKKLGSQRNLDFAAGASRTIKLPLSASGRHALAGLGSATVKVIATVPFGAQVTTHRKLG